jgi:hypothetical protein
VQVPDDELTIRPCLAPAQHTATAAHGGRGRVRCMHSDRFRFLHRVIASAD